MCYATALRKQQEAIEQRLLNQLQAKFKAPKTFKPYYHRNGFTYNSLHIINMDEPKSIQAATWGFIPDWATHNPNAFRKKSNTLNARCETIFDKPTFKNSAEEKRCLILADGFFEPHHENGIIHPYFCYQPSTEYPEGDLFLFAGLYNTLNNDTLSTTILTTAANPFFAEIHNKQKRMPLVLDPYYFEDWLDPNMSQQSINELIATGFSNIPFQAHRVSRDLYKKDVETNLPSIIKKV